MSWQRGGRGAAVTAALYSASDADDDDDDDNKDGCVHDTCHYDVDDDSAVLYRGACAVLLRGLLLQTCHVLCALHALRGGGDSSTAEEMTRTAPVTTSPALFASPAHARACVQHSSLYALLTTAHLLRCPALMQYVRSMHHHNTTTTTAAAAATTSCAQHSPCRPHHNDTHDNNKDDDETTRCVLARCVGAALDDDVWCATTLVLLSEYIQQRWHATAPTSPPHRHTHCGSDTCCARGDGGDDVYYTSVVAVLLRHAVDCSTWRAPHTTPRVQPHRQHNVDDDDDGRGGTQRQTATRAVAPLHCRVFCTHDDDASEQQQGDNNKSSKKRLGTCTAAAAAATATTHTCRILSLCRCRHRWLCDDVAQWLVHIAQHEYAAAHAQRLRCAHVLRQWQLRRGMALLRRLGTSCLQLQQQQQHERHTKEHVCAQGNSSSNCNNTTATTAADVSTTLPRADGTCVEPDVSGIAHVADDADDDDDEEDRRNDDVHDNNNDDSKDATGVTLDVSPPHAERTVALTLLHNDDDDDSNNNNDSHITATTTANTTMTRGTDAAAMRSSSSSSRHTRSGATVSTALVTVTDTSALLQQQQQQHSSSSATAALSLLRSLFMHWRDVRLYTRIAQRYATAQQRQRRLQHCLALWRRHTRARQRRRRRRAQAALCRRLRVQHACARLRRRLQHWRAAARARQRLRRDAGMCAWRQWCTRMHWRCYVRNQQLQQQQHCRRHVETLQQHMCGAHVRGRALLRVLWLHWRRRCDAQRAHAAWRRRVLVRCLHAWRSSAQLRARVAACRAAQATRQTRTLLQHWQHRIRARAQARRRSSVSDSSSSSARLTTMAAAPTTNVVVVVVDDDGDKKEQHAAAQLAAQQRRVRLATCLRHWRVRLRQQRAMRALHTTLQRLRRHACVRQWRRRACVATVLTCAQAQRAHMLQWRCLRQWRTRTALRVALLRDVCALAGDVLHPQLRQRCVLRQWQRRAAEARCARAQQRDAAARATADALWCCRCAVRVLSRWRRALLLRQLRHRCRADTLRSSLAASQSAPVRMTTTTTATTITRRQRQAATGVLRAERQLLRVQWHKAAWQREQLQRQQQHDECVVYTRAVRSCSVWWSTSGDDAVDAAAGNDERDTDTAAAAAVQHNTAPLRRCHYRHDDSNNNAAAAAATEGLNVSAITAMATSRVDADDTTLSL